MLLKLVLGVLVGHILGDYFYQPLHVAVDKSKPGIAGALTCFLHSLLYGLMVLGALGILGCISGSVQGVLVVIVSVVSHYPIDRWSLAAVWLKILKGREVALSDEPATQKDAVNAAFAALVYTIIDNSMHLFILIPALWWLLHW